MKKLLFVLGGLFTAGLLSAQTIFQEIAENNIPSAKERWIVPRHYRTIQLDRAAIQGLVDQVVGQHVVADRGGDQPIVSLPLPGGGAARFRLAESGVMAPELQSRYPEIRCFTGYGIDDPSALLKCDWTPKGFRAMMFLTGKGTAYIDPYAPGDMEHYIVYYKKDYARAAGQEMKFSCGVEPPAADSELPIPDRPLAVSERSGTDGQLRRYRLAIACTGEYAQFQGGTKTLAMAAIASSANRITGIYEREYAVTMQLIGKNDTLIFLDGALDPYENGNTGVMLGQNRTVLLDRITNGSFDIGHVYGTHPSVSGLATLQSVCTLNKAQGVSCFFSPIGDAFDVDVVAHEMGHQFGGNHTQNNDCNRRDGTSMEPGSGSTIMSYAGICPPNVQSLSDDYYHGVNVAEMVNFIVSGDGNNCPVKTPIDNIAPTVNAGSDFAIPKSTPFVLNAQADDANGAENTLTYCWEQMDYDAADMPPVSTSTLGPLFRTFDPVAQPYRYFPRFQDIVQNINSTWEELPSVGRKMNFRITVRDNHPAGGHTAQDDMVITVANDAGPFSVANPGAPWRAGSWQIVSWDVANTDKTPVNCKTVNIRLSTDGGYNYPITLASGVPNTGKHCVLVPNITTTQARLLVESVGNIFFDINNGNFSITPAPAPAFSMCLSELSGQICLPGVYTATVSTAALQGFDKPITLSADGLPPGAVASFSPNPVMPGTDAEVTLSFPDGTPEGVLDVDIIGTADSTGFSILTNLTLVSNDFSGLALQSPANGAIGQIENPILYWQTVADANNYDVELATNPSFDQVVMVASRQNVLVDSFKIPVILEKGTVYYWRVRPKNECGPGPWAGPFAFAVVVNTCSVRNAGGLPINITQNQATTVESKIAFSGSSIVSDVNVAKIQGSHTFFKELEMLLISPKGTEVQLFKGKCGGFSGNFNFGFDDASPTTGLACPPTNLGLIFKPDNPLSKFNGEDAAGEWTLRVKDDSPGSGGQITAFSIELCANTALNPPVLVNNNTLFVEPGNNKVVTTDLLLSTDANNSDDELIYTLMTKPGQGELQLNWGGNALQPGAQFSQAALNSGGLRYFDYGTGAGPDQFCFTVTDGEGGLIVDCFTIQPFPVGTGEQSRALGFLLAPNPATETVRIAFGEPLQADTRIRLFDMSGRLLRDVSLAGGQLTVLLDVADLPEGIYSVIADNAMGSGVRKVVVR